MGTGMGENDGYGGQGQGGDWGDPRWMEGDPYADGYDDEGQGNHG